MCSTPEPIDHVVHARGDQRRAEVHGLLRGTALPIDGGRRRLRRQPRLQPRVAPDVEHLLAVLLHAARDHVFDGIAGSMPARAITSV